MTVTGTDCRVPPPIHSPAHDLSDEDYQQTREDLREKEREMKCWRQKELLPGAPFKTQAVFMFLSPLGADRSR